MQLLRVVRPPQLLRLDSRSALLLDEYWGDADGDDQSLSDGELDDVTVSTANSLRDPRSTKDGYTGEPLDRPGLQLLVLNYDHTTVESDNNGDFSVSEPRSNTINDGQYMSDIDNLKHIAGIGFTAEHQHARTTERISSTMETSIQAAAQDDKEAHQTMPVDAIRQKSEDATSTTNIAPNTNLRHLDNLRTPLVLGQLHLRDQLIANGTLRATLPHESIPGTFTWSHAIASCPFSTDLGRFEIRRMAIMQGVRMRTRQRAAWKVFQHWMECERERVRRRRGKHSET